MPGKEPIPSGYEKREAFASQELVQYNDGALNLLFAGEGDRIAWGKHKYADPELSSLDRIIVRTKSGNRYFIGDGLVISARDSTVHDLWVDGAEPLPDIIIGEQWEIPGYMTTSDVENVELQYKIGDMPDARQIDRPNPFIVVENWLRIADDELHKIGKRHY